MLEGTTFGRFYAVWCRPAGSAPGLDMDALRDQINAARAKRGLPPMRPAAADRKG